MAIPSSGQISILELAREKKYDDYQDQRIPDTSGINKFPYPMDGYEWLSDNNTFSDTGNNCNLDRDGTLAPPVASFPAGGESPAPYGPLKMVCTGTDAYTYTYGDADYRHTAGTQSETWTFSFYAKASTTLTAQIFMFSAKSTGLIIGNSSYNYPNANQAYRSTNISITTSWQRFEMTHQLCSSTNSSNDCQYIQVRLDGQDAYNTNTIWWDGFQLEEASSATAFFMNGPYALGDLVDGGESNSSIVFETTNTNSATYPNTTSPDYMNEWYSYDHDAVRATAQILLHSNGSDPGTADSYSFGPFAGMSYSSIYRAVITNISGNTVITGNDAHFYLAAEGADTTPDNYASPGSFSISSAYSTFYFRIKRSIDSFEGVDSTLITVTPALPSGGTRTADTITINFSWGFGE